MRKIKICVVGTTMFPLEFPLDFEVEGNLPSFSGRCEIRNKILKDEYGKMMLSKENDEYVVVGVQVTTDGERWLTNNK